MKKYVVIGSNCFTGCHFVDELVKNPDNQVIGISRSAEKSDLYLPYKKQNPANFKFHQLDLNHDMDKIFKLLDEFKPEVIIQVAGLSEVVLSHDKPHEYFNVNTLGIVDLAFRLRSRTWLKRYLHISSAEIYGPCKDPILETAPLDPTTPYAVSKAAGDMYLLTLYKNFKFPVTLIRSTNVYGQYQQLFKIIPRTAIFVKTGKVIELHGGGVSVKSFIHVRDVVRGALRVPEVQNPSPIYHFSTTNPNRIVDIVNRVCELMGKDPKDHTRIVGERLGQDSRYLLDCSLAKKELGWEPQVDFDEGLKETINWIESNWGLIQKEPLTYIHKV